MGILIKEKTIYIQGEKGSKGEACENDTTIPYDSIIAFGGGEIPEGYTLYYDTEG